MAKHSKPKTAGGSRTVRILCLALCALVLVGAVTAGVWVWGNPFLPTQAAPEPPAPSPSGSVGGTEGSSSSSTVNGQASGSVTADSRTSRSGQAETGTSTNPSSPDNATASVTPPAGTSTATDRPGGTSTTVTTAPTTSVTGPTDILPTPSASERRAVWVSYIEIGRWLVGSAESVRQSINTLMDDCVRHRLNTVFFHVRSAGNAFYRSDWFPIDASTQRLLQNGLDPLAYAVQAAHARGLELHAWINPYRAGVSEASLVDALRNDAFWFGGRFYYDPASPAVQEQIVHGVREVCERYAVDGIHFDDYFYPEDAVPATAPADFEEAEYTAYRASGGTASVADWRRGRVTALLKEVYRTAHAYGAEFGVSPMAQITGNELKKYADVRAWLASADTVDYLCPQMYYGFENTSLPFETALATWCALPRHPSVKLYVGLGLYKAGMPEDAWAGGGRTEWAQGGTIFARQLALLRQADVDGFALYSYDYLNGATFDRPIGGIQHDAAVARREIEALLAAI